MRAAAVSVGVCALLVATSTVSTVSARKNGGCGPQYSGQPYLKCNRHEGREAIPEICTRSYRNCNGVKVYINTVCVAPTRGSIEHQILASACNAIATDHPPAPEEAVPPELDVDDFLDSNTPDPLKLYPEVKEFDFPGDGIDGPVPAHRHPNGRGIVADSVKMEQPESIYIGPEALVHGNAYLGSDVSIMGRAQVYGDAVVTSGSFVGDDAKVFGRAQLHYHAGVLEQAWVAGGRVECGGMVRDHAVVGGKTTVDGYAPKGEIACGKLFMSEKPGVVGGKAVLYCSKVSAGEMVLEGQTCTE